jgi:hypothetical protein
VLIWNATPEQGVLAPEHPGFYEHGRPRRGGFFLGGNFVFIQQHHSNRASLAERTARFFLPPLNSVSKVQILDFGSQLFRGQLP